MGDTLAGLGPEATDEGGLPGTTVTLTAEGWESADYVAPEDDWTLEDDGAWQAPDGRTRTWLTASERPT